MLSWRRRINSKRRKGTQDNLMEDAERKRPGIWKRIGGGQLKQNSNVTRNV
jgi:hypothetical protein